MIFNSADYRKKVLGCWLGKNIGGTAGMPFEWKRQVNNITFYTQELNGEPLPNDDLDIQLLWLWGLEDRGLSFNAHTMAEYWCLYVTPHWSEYGTGKINMRSGLVPPLCGTYQNDFKDSCGAFIRSEIWACIAPALPGMAVSYAIQDAILDHGDGEGTHAAAFCAALESAAFAISDLRQLIEIGLSYMPENCETAKAVRTAMECFDKGIGWRDARDEILRRHRGGTFMNWMQHTSPEDQAKGFHTGKLGFDAPSNIGLTVLALLYGKGDFGDTICLAVNCGEDTDCTAATAGSIFGIIYGADKIPQKWIDPIGRGIKTISLDMGDIGWAIPKTVDELTDRTLRVARQAVLRQRQSPVGISDIDKTDLSDANPERFLAKNQKFVLGENLSGPVYIFDLFDVAVEYVDGPAIKANQPKRLRFSIKNKLGIQANLALHWYLPDGWAATPGRDANVLSLPTHLSRDGKGTRSFEFTLQTEKLDRSINRAVLEISCEGRPTVMLVPVALINGSLD